MLECQYRFVQLYFCKNRQDFLRDRKGILSLKQNLLVKSSINGAGNRRNEERKRNVYETCEIPSEMQRNDATLPITSYGLHRQPIH
jgi:hypothetical protein